jgi:hypothetical protein
MRKKEQKYNSFTCGQKRCRSGYTLLPVEEEEVEEEEEDDDVI